MTVRFTPQPSQSSNLAIRSRSTGGHSTAIDDVGPHMTMGSFKTMSSTGSDWFPEAGSRWMASQGLPSNPMNLEGLPGVYESDVMKAFNEIDFDQNGFVGASELRYMLMVQGERPTDEELDEMLRMADCGGDGQLSYADFLKLLSPGGVVPTEMAYMVSQLEKQKAAADAAAEQERQELEARSTDGMKTKLPGPSVRDMDLMLKAASGFLYVKDKPKSANTSATNNFRTHEKQPGAIRARPSKAAPPLALSPRVNRSVSRMSRLADKGKGKGKNMSRGIGMQ